MGNPGEGAGKLGHEGRSNEAPKVQPPPYIAKKLGQMVVSGSQKH